MMEYRVVLSSFSFAEICLILLTIIGAYVVYKLIYNAFFHPLYKFPGPWLAGATHWYLDYYKVLGQSHTIVKRLHDIYGPVVRLAPDKLSFIGDSAWKEIYSHRGTNRAQMQKGDGRGPRPNPPYHVINAPDHVHARQRKILVTSFSERALREKESLLIDYVDQLGAILREHAKDGQPANIVDYLEFTTSDIISDFCFTDSYGQLKSKEQEPVIAALHRFFPIEARTSVLPRPLAIFLLINFLSVDTLKLINKAEEAVKSRLEKNAGKNDVMQHIRANISEDGEEGITLTELGQNATILMIAGSETTATTLAGTFFYLLKNESVLKKLVEEIRSNFQSKDQIVADKLVRLPYLNAVIEESLRIFSPVPVALNRVTPPEGASICGHWVPGNITVGVPHYAAYRSTRNFSDPLSFRPERWLRDLSPEFMNDNHAVFQPFSYGPRNCLGMALAYAEMRLIISRLFFDFDFAFVDKDSRWDEQQAFVLYRKPPLMIHAKLRD